MLLNLHGAQHRVVKSRWKYAKKWVYCDLPLWGGDWSK